MAASETATDSIEAVEDVAHATPGAGAAAAQALCKTVEARRDTPPHVVNDDVVAVPQFSSFFIVRFAS
jgi:hypothetical protein